MNTTILQPNANHATDIKTALQNAGMDWTVEKKPIFIESSYRPDGHAEIADKYATVRSDIAGPASVLGVVGSKYHVIQNEDALGILDDVIAGDTTREAHYDSILSLGGGARVAASVKLSSFEIVPGDRSDNYLTAITSHDGSSSTQLMLLSFRLACFNASRRAIAEAKGTGRIATISHTISAASRLAVARKALLGSTYSVQAFEEQLRELSTRQLNRETTQSILDRLFPIPQGELVSDSSVTKMENKRAKFLELFESNDNNTFSLIRGTAYNAYNAFTEYVDHHQRVVRTNAKTGMMEYEIRQERALFGTGADDKEKALDAILEATRFAPRRSLPITLAASAGYNSNASLLDAIITN